MSRASGRRGTPRQIGSQLAKCPTGIIGLDEITGGGLPRGRPTLVCGPAGCGKTLMAMEFIVRGITEFNEPGVFMSFEETAQELADNVTSLGFDLDGLVRRKKLAMDYVHIERSEIEGTGEYNLEGLFVRLALAIDTVGARRVALDSIEALFAGLPDEAILRAELRRLFRWLKSKRVTAVITGEQGLNALTRYGIEEYVSDCVIFLDHRVTNQMATRRLRVVKYRGSAHGTNEYPTLIDERGLSILPISSLGLTYPVSDERVSTGVPRLDAMLGGKGYYRGSSVLVSGTAGTGKSSLAAAFADRTCRDGGRCLYFSFEESPSQIARNMRSIGIDLDRWRKKGVLQFNSVRPSFYGLEMHLASIHKLVIDFSPQTVVMDPVTTMMNIGEGSEIQAMLVRAIDFLKSQGITTLFTSLTAAGTSPEQSEVGISSLMDTWLLLRMIEGSGERNRLLYVLKSRGMAHSNQMREFELTDAGFGLVDVYVGSGQVLTGSARLAQEATDQAGAVASRRAADLRGRELRHERDSLEMEMASLHNKLRDVKTELGLAKQRNQEDTVRARREQDRMGQARRAD